METQRRRNMDGSGNAEEGSKEERRRLEKNPEGHRKTLKKKDWTSTQIKGGGASRKGQLDRAYAEKQMH